LRSYHACSDALVLFTAAAAAIVDDNWPGFAINYVDIWFVDNYLWVGLSVGLSVGLLFGLSVGLSVGVLVVLFTAAAAAIVDDNMPGFVMNYVDILQ